jgi:hypothetical protein
MKKQWFKPYGWIHVPVSLPGALITLGIVLFCVQVFTAIDRTSHSATDTLYRIFPFFACSFLLFEWIASRSNGRGHDQSPSAEKRIPLRNS